MPVPVPYLIECVKSRLGSGKGWFGFSQVFLAVLLLLLDLLGYQCHFLLLLIGDGFLCAHLLRLHTNHLNQLVGIVILLLQLHFLGCQLRLQAIYLQ